MLQNFDVVHYDPKSERFLLCGITSHIEDQESRKKCFTWRYGSGLKNSSMEMLDQHQDGASVEVEGNLWVAGGIGNGGKGTFVKNIYVHLMLKLMTSISSSCQNRALHRWPMACWTRPPRGSRRSLHRQT